MRRRAEQVREEERRRKDFLVDSSDFASAMACGLLHKQPSAERLVDQYSFNNVPYLFDVCYVLEMAAGEASVTEYETLKLRIGKEAADQMVLSGLIAPPEEASPRNALSVDFADEAGTVPDSLEASRRAHLGQFLTPNDVSTFMAGLFSEMPQFVRLLDAGAGKGALTEAFVRQWRRGGAGRLTAHAYEFDQVVLGELRDAALKLGLLEDVDVHIVEGDFVEAAATMLRLNTGPRYTHAILNPPYRKIGATSDHRRFLRAAGLETVNLYSGFVGLALALIEDGGELVAIIPRSFCNGPYYQPFRRFIFAHAAIRHIHLFDARNKAFKGDGVLQENVIIHLERGAAQGEVAISTSTDATFSDYQKTVHQFDRIVFPDDAEQFIHIPTGDTVEMLESAAFSHSLEDLGISVSTGPVVDFRMKEYLRSDPEPGTVPLIYPGHFNANGLTWPKPGFKKANAIQHTPATAKWLFPKGFYVVVRRFSSKEERRRIVANVVEPTALSADLIGFENHLNVLHDQKGPLSEIMAYGISAYLNATAVDKYFRRFNGHTQVNATDLRTMRYPSREVLLSLGTWAKENRRPTQEAINKQVAEIV